MVVDTSAVIAILLKEPELELFTHLMASAPRVRMSTANVVEAGLVAFEAGGKRGEADLDAILESLGVEYVPVNFGQVGLARGALQRFGKGQHKARLNLGDSFAYALAMHLSEPLLFKGNDFAQTDVRRVAWDQSNTTLGK